MRFRSMSNCSFERSFSWYGFLNAGAAMSATCGYVSGCAQFLAACLWRSRCVRGAVVGARGRDACFGNSENRRHRPKDLVIPTWVEAGRGKGPNAHPLAGRRRSVPGFTSVATDLWWKRLAGWCAPTALGPFAGPGKGRRTPTPPASSLRAARPRPEPGCPTDRHEELRIGGPCR